MNKLSLVLATAGLSASLGAYAALPTGAPPFKLTVPNITPGVSVLLEGMFFRPTYDNIQGGQFNTFDGGNDDDGEGFQFSRESNHSNSLNSQYNWAFRVGLGYTFPESGNDVQLAWTHFDKSNDTSNSHDRVNFNDRRDFFILPSGIVVDFDRTESGIDVDSSQSIRYDAVDLDVGQYINIGTRLQVRLAGGPRFARVKQGFDNSVSFAFERDRHHHDEVITPEDPDRDRHHEREFVDVSISHDVDSRFEGVGPRFVIDTSYHLGYCFGIAGHFAAALLVGKTKTTNEVNIDIDEIEIDRDHDRHWVGDEHEHERERDISFSFGGDTDNSNRVVPNFDAKVGLNWTNEFANKSTLTIEAGYQVVEYINAIDRIHSVIGSGGDVIGAAPLDGEDGRDSIRASKSRRGTNSVGFDGPYFGVQFRV